MGRRRGKRGSHPRAEVTLRGVRFTDHPRNPAEVRGRVVEWERVGLVQSNGRLAGVRIFRPDGSEARLGRFSQPIPLGGYEGSVALRAHRRHWKRLIESGGFAMIERFPGSRHSKWALLVPSSLAAALVYLVAAQVMPGMLRGFWQQPGSTKLLMIATAVGMGLSVGVVAGVMAAMVRVLGRLNVREIGCTGSGVEVVTLDGRRMSRGWDELARVRESWGTWTLRFSDGKRVHMQTRRCRLLLEHHRERLQPGRTAREARALKQTLIRSAVLFQVGGLACAVAMMWVQLLGMPVAPGALGPIGTYLMVAFAIPLAMAAQMGAPRALARLESWRWRRKRNRERAARSSGHAGA